MKNFPTYKGMMADRREIDHTDWRWCYIYINKNADKNAKRLETLKKNQTTLNDRQLKYTEICSECYSKVCQMFENVGEFDAFDIFDTKFDNLKSIDSLRKKYQKSQEMINEIQSKIDEIKSEIETILNDGIEREIRVKSNDIVNAFDMQAYVKLHPEIFNKK